MLGIWKSPVQALVLGVTFSVCMNSASALKIEVIPTEPKLGDTVLLKVTGVTGALRFATWYKGQSTNASDQILNYFSSHPEIHGAKYFKEAHGQANGSLVIDNVRKDFNGYYTVQIQTSESLQQGSVLLTVNGVLSIVLSPLAPLLGLLLFSDLNFL